MNDPNQRGLSPLIFLNDYAREEFWSMLDTIRDRIEDNEKKPLDHMRENQELKKQIDS